MRLIEAVASSADLHAHPVDAKLELKRSLEDMTNRLQSKNHDWSAVKLLWLSSSRDFTAQESGGSVAAAQESFDSLMLEVLDEHCEEHHWWPSLVGCTVKSAFHMSEDVEEADLQDGVMWVAFTHDLLTRVPVGTEITDQGDAPRSAAGRLALERAAHDLSHALSMRFPGAAKSVAACERALGLVFTSGSGHVAAAHGGVDFRDCYAVGQELLAAADDLGLTLTGGCASNRAPSQSQALYYSTEDPGGRVRYHTTYGHGAVIALLPVAEATVQLDHPYRRVSDEQLSVGFHPHERYAEGRFFCISSINGRTPRDFLQEHWTEISPAEFQEMVDKGLPIPAKPKAHYFSVASSSSEDVGSIWPNIPVYFEKVGNETLLRLVRAESENSYFYLIRMTPEELMKNAQDLAQSIRVQGETGDNVVTFLCESRKYVLEDLGSNAEVETMATSIPAGGNLLGVYLNGEYSTGADRSIGYHNYSQIGILMSESTKEDVPRVWGTAAQ